MPAVRREEQPYDYEVRNEREAYEHLNGNGSRSVRFDLAMPS